MMHADSLTIDPKVGKLNFPLSNRRLIRGENSPPPAPRRSVARTLFGIPDPVKTKEFFQRVCESHQAEFRQRWNFDPVTGLPCSSASSSSSTNTPNPEKSTEPKFIWTQIFPVLNEDLPVDVAASTPPPQTISIERPSVNNKSAGVNQVHLYVSRERSPDPSPSPIKTKRFCPATVLRQRHITDYMRVRKPLAGEPGREKRRITE